MAAQEPRCCSTCKQFRVCDPDVFSLITKGRCLHPETHFSSPAAVGVCWLHEPGGHVRKALHQLAGRVRAWQRWYFPRRVR